MQQQTNNQNQGHPAGVPFQYQPPMYMNAPGDPNGMMNPAAAGANRGGPPSNAANQGSRDFNTYGAPRPDLAQQNSQQESTSQSEGPRQSINHQQLQHPQALPSQPGEVMGQQPGGMPYPQSPEMVGKVYMSNPPVYYQMPPQAMMSADGQQQLQMMNDPNQMAYASAPGVSGVPGQQQVGSPQPNFYPSPQQREDQSEENKQESSLGSTAQRDKEMMERWGFATSSINNSVIRSPHRQSEEAAQEASQDSQKQHPMSSPSQPPVVMPEGAAQQMHGYAQGNIQVLQQQPGVQIQSQQPNEGGGNIPHALPQYQGGMLPGQSAQLGQPGDQGQPFPLQPSGQVIGNLPVGSGSQASSHTGAPPGLLQVPQSQGMVPYGNLPPGALPGPMHYYQNSVNNGSMQHNTSSQMGNNTSINSQISSIRATEQQQQQPYGQMIPLGNGQYAISTEQSSVQQSYYYGMQDPRNQVRSNSQGAGALINDSIMSNGLAPHQQSSEMSNDLPPNIVAVQNEIRQQLQGIPAGGSQQSQGVPSSPPPNQIGSFQNQIRPSTGDSADQMRMQYYPQNNGGSQSNPSAQLIANQYSEARRKKKKQRNLHRPQSLDGREPEEGKSSDDSSSLQHDDAYPHDSSSYSDSDGMIFRHVAGENDNNIPGAGPYGAQADSRSSNLLPIQFAKEHIVKIEDDMKKLHGRHVKLMKDMDENYKLIEKESQEYYVEFLNKWKEVAKQKIMQYRKTTEALSQEKEALEKEKNLQIDQLNEEKTKYLVEKEQLLQKLNENIQSRETELEHLRIQLEGEIKKKEQEAFNSMSALKQKEMQLTEMEVRFKTEFEQFRAQMEELNKQNQELINNEEAQAESMEKLKSQLLSSQQEIAHLKDSQNRWMAERDGMSTVIDDANEKLSDKSKEVDTLLSQVNNLEKQIADLKQNSHLPNFHDHNQTSASIQSSSLEDPKRLHIDVTSVGGNSLNQSDIRFGPGGGAQLQQIVDKIQNYNPQIRVQSDRLKFSSNQQPAIGGRPLKIKHGGNLQNIIAAGGGIRPKSQQRNQQLQPAGPAPMSEQEFNSQQEKLHQELQGKLSEIADLSEHYKERLSQIAAVGGSSNVAYAYDQKIASRLIEEKTQLRLKYEGDLSKLKQAFELSKKAEVLKNNNISLKINRKVSTARKGAPSDALSSSNGDQPKNPQSMLSDNKVGSHIGSVLETGSISKHEEIKQGHGDYPYGGPSQHPKIANFNSMLEKKVSNDGLDQHPGESPNSARDLPSNRDKSSRYKDGLVNDLKDQLRRMAQEHTRRVQELQSQIAEKEQELKQTKEKLASISDLYRQQQNQSKLTESAKAVESLQKELEEERQKHRTKKLEYNQYIQYAKNKMETVKGQNQQLKDLVTKTQQDKQTLKSRLHSLEEVKTQLKDQLEQLRTESRQKMSQIQATNQELNEKNERLWIKFQNESLHRKRLHNTIEDMKGKIRVYCRVRPMSQNEQNMGCQNAVTIVDQFTLRIRVKADKGLYAQGNQQAFAEKEYLFDSCFGDRASQADVFEDTKMLIQSAIDGYNVCIFAYGQTGSGKTFTVTGESGDKIGIVPRSFQELFSLKNKMERDGLFTVKLECYMVELYLDKLYDLLKQGGRTAQAEKLEIREDPNTRMVFVQNAKVKGIQSIQEAMDVFNQGLRHRKVQTTEMNDVSSRSHLVYSVVIECKSTATGDVTRGKISFVDLAGSERQNKANPNHQVDRLKESNAINMSLKSLGDVIQVLSNGNQERAHIPYRANKLTHLMKDSLGGNSKTLMFVNISPADYNSQESLYSLQFGDRVKLVQNDAQKNKS